MQLENNPHRTSSNIPNVLLAQESNTSQRMRCYCVAALKLIPYLTKINKVAEISAHIIITRKCICITICLKEFDNFANYSMRDKYFAIRCDYPSHPFAIFETFSYHWIVLNCSLTCTCKSKIFLTGCWAIPSDCGHYWAQIDRLEFLQMCIFMMLADVQAERLRPLLGF